MPAMEVVASVGSDPQAGGEFTRGRATVAGRAGKTEGERVSAGAVDSRPTDGALAPVAACGYHGGSAAEERRGCSSSPKPDIKGPTMSIVSEFKEFAVKGNVIDLAVGVIIGAAFGKIVDSVVNDLIMPLIGKVTGGLDFSSYYIGLNGQPGGLPLAEAKKAGAVFAYGNFITVALYFVILAFIIFLMVKQINRLKREAPPPAPAATPEDIVLLREIRDSLRK
jgi:large conductance mechanosensitive channel